MGWILICTIQRRATRIRMATHIRSDQPLYAKAIVVLIRPAIEVLRAVRLTAPTTMPILARVNPINSQPRAETALTITAMDTQMRLRTETGPEIPWVVSTIRFSILCRAPMNFGPPVTAAVSRSVSMRPTGGLVGPKTFLEWPVDNKTSY